MWFTVYLAIVYRYADLGLSHGIPWSILRVSIYIFFLLGKVTLNNFTANVKSENVLRVRNVKSEVYEWK